MRSRKVDVVLVDGTAFGIKTAELSNWSGRLISGPRNAIKKLSEVKTVDMSAVYFLINETNEVYVGETDSLNKRLAQHALMKPDWTEFVALTSEKLTKTSVRYLEYLFVKRLIEGGLTILKNSVAPTPPNILKIEIDELEAFVD